jgi:ABC-type sugar transport system permease subunit
MRSVSTLSSVTAAPELALVLALAGVATALLAGLGLAAFLRRRSRSYLLVALALGTLFARPVVATMTVLDLLDSAPHHLVEHGLDTLMAACVVGAVYHARSAGEADRTAGGRPDE